MTWASRVRFPAEARNVLLSEASRQALGPAEPPIQWVLVTHYPSAKQPRHEAHCSSSSTADTRTECSFTPTPTTAFVLHRDKQTLTFALNAISVCGQSTIMGNKNISCKRQVSTLNYNSDYLPDTPSLYLYYTILILLDNYRLSPPVANPPRVWQVEQVGRVITIHKPTANASRQLSVKIIILYYRMENWYCVAVQRVVHAN